MWLPLWRRKMNPARSSAARTSRPDRPVGSLATCSQSLRLRGVDFDKLLAGLGRNRITGVAAILDVQLNRLADVGQRLGAVVPLAHAPRQRRHARDIASIFF